MASTSKTFEEFLTESEHVTNVSHQDGDDTSNIANRHDRMDLGKDGNGKENHIAKRKPTPSAYVTNMYKIKPRKEFFH